MKLGEAFHINRGDVVAFIGAGGKTATMIGLGYELAEAGWRVLATTTMHITPDQLALFPDALTPHAGAATISEALSVSRFAFIYTGIDDDQVFGLPPERISWLLDSVDADILLIEADDAAGLPLKAPLEGEPIIPKETTLVVPIASLSALGQPLDDEHVYNTKAIIDRYGFAEEASIKSPWIAQIIRDETLGLHGVPQKARVIALLNQTPGSGYLRGRARLIARLVLRSPRVNGVALGAVRSATPVYEVQRPVGAVVLAAGMSTRMGEHKLMLPWIDRKPIIQHILEQLRLARVDHITVVTGHRADDVAAIAERVGVDCVHNPKYEQGEMLSSLKVGFKAMPKHIAGAMVVLGDQPRIQPRIVMQVMMAYAEGQGTIIAPSYQMRRGHPILIDRRYWKDILKLPDTSALREIINANADSIGYVNVDTDSVLRDVDTPQDYKDERWRAGLNG